VNRAVAQLSYSYSLSEVEAAPLRADCAPGTIIMCQDHLDKFTPPKGWTLIRSGHVVSRVLEPTQMDALAAEIRRVGLGTAAGAPDGTEHSLSSRANLVMLATRAHLRVVADSGGHGAARAH